MPFFLDTIAEVSRVKPIVILKGGRSHSGQRAALSHTGSLAGDGRVWENLMREAGATFVESSEELFDVAAALARCRRLPQGRRAAIFSLAVAPAWSPPTIARRAASRCRRSRSNCNRCARSCRRSRRSAIRLK